MASYLDRIVTAHRASAAADTRDPAAIRASAEAVAGLPRGLGAALRADYEAGYVAVIAEVKRRSPSRGDLAADLDPADLARGYAAAGAAAISVLTDEEFFGGSPADLRAARAVCDRPVLRKDFTVVEADVLDARAMGADAVLLIAAVLDDPTLVDLRSLASELGLDALIEVHDETELDRALAAGADLVGVNQRDLVTFEVDTSRAERMGRVIPAGVVAVAESGLRGPDDAARLAAAGYHAVLVGEALVTSVDPGAGVAALRGARGPNP